MGALEHLEQDAGEELEGSASAVALREIPSRLPTILFCDDSYLSLLYDPWFKSGGATRQVVAWVDGLTQLGVNVKVLGAHSKEEFFRQRANTILSYDPNRGIPKLRYVYIRGPGLIKGLLRSGADFVYYGVPSPYAGFLALCTFLTRRRFILRVSNDIFVDERARGGFGWLRYGWFFLGFKVADSILCQNDYQLRKLQARYPGKVHKIHNPYAGVLLQRAAAFEDRKYVVWIGIFQHQKNLPLLLQIARESPKVEFRVAGGHDKRLDRKDQGALEKLGQLPNVRFMGFLDHPGVCRLLDQAFLLLNTSHYEGFSNTFLEAFSRGTPVFTLRQNDPDGILAAHGLGRVFSESGGIAPGIADFIGEPSAFEAMSTRCLRYMEEHHDLTTQATHFLELIGRQRR
jgi:glycosyltransferase involved in cell wall biosynthesis